MKGSTTTVRRWPPLHARRRPPRSGRAARSARSHPRADEAARDFGALAVDVVLAREEGHVPPVAAAAFPDREADQLQAGWHAVFEVQFGLREFSRWLPRSFAVILTVAVCVVAFSVLRLSEPLLVPSPA
jgi:hypothetical protein